MKNSIPLNKLQSYTPQILLIVSVVAFVAVFLFLKPIPQNIHYHAFANENSFFGISNFANIISNVSFILVGLFGLSTCIKLKQFDPIGVSLVAGIILTGFGSGYYHYAPNILNRKRDITYSHDFFIRDLIVRKHLPECFHSFF